jgi:hypothetical protein
MPITRGPAYAVTATALLSLAALAYVRSTVPARQQPQRVAVEAGYGAGIAQQPQDAAVGYGGYGVTQQPEHQQAAVDNSYGSYGAARPQETAVDVNSDSYSAEPQPQQSPQQARQTAAGGGYAGYGASLADCMIRGGKLNRATAECEGGFGGG